MFRIRTLSLFLLAAAAFGPGKVDANTNVAGEPSEPAPAVIEASSEATPPTDRQLTSPTQLSPRIRSILGLPDADIVPEAFGEGNHPFTTQRASAFDDIAPINKSPWRATGKLLMVFDGQNFVCTASVIDKNLLVTAAHCVHNFGQGQDGFADSLAFEPARHEGERPFGTWTATQWFIPEVYFDGTDVCSAEAPGVVCENDVAVVVLEPLDGMNIADVVGKYDVVQNDNFGYVFFLGQNSAHLTQLGYPSANFDGDKMIRSNSLGYQDDPNNVIIGSNQTGGSSGGPWLQNFGTATSSTGPVPSDAALNVVAAVTSWGFTSGQEKVQGASRFSMNTTYTDTSNILSLIESACAANPDACE